MNGTIVIEIETDDLPQSLSPSVATTILEILEITIANLSGVTNVLIRSQWE